MLCQDKLWQFKSLYNTVVSPAIIVHWFANGIYDWLPLTGNCDMCMGSSAGPVFSNIWDSAIHGINHYPMAKR